MTLRAAIWLPANPEALPEPLKLTASSTVPPVPVLSSPVSWEQPESILPECLPPVSSDGEMGRKGRRTAGPL